MARSANSFFKLEMLLLKILEKHECYGYQIVQILDKASNGNVRLVQGTMYPILYKLLEEGYIKDDKRLVGKRQTRTYYSIEPKGLEYLKELTNEYYRVKNSIDDIMEGIDEKLYEEVSK